MANINDLKLRNTSKKNLQRTSKTANKYDFVVKKGVTQDDLGFMSPLDIPMINPLTGMQCTLNEYILSTAQEVIEMRKEVERLDNKYKTINEEYQKILEVGSAEYLAQLLNL